MLRTLERLESRSAYFLVVLVALVLLVPKVNLVSFGPYEGAGLRVEDFLILLFLGLVGPVWVWYARTVSRLEVAFFLFTAASLATLLVNQIFARGSILFALRLLEYWAMFYGGFLAARCKSGKVVLEWLLVLNCSAIFLQYFHVIGGWSNGVYSPILARPTGLTNGAYEAPFVVGLISIYLCRQLGGWRLYGSILIAVIAIMMSGARIVLAGFLLATIIAFYLRPPQQRRQRSHRAVAPVTFLGIIALAAYSAAPQLLERFRNLGDFGVIGSDVAALYTNAVGERDGATGKEFERSQHTLRTEEAKPYIENQLSLSADLSLLVRTNKWFWAVKSFFNQGFGIYLVGVGPGVMGNALDSGILRVFVETGILGILLFINFLYQAIRTNPAALLPSVAFFAMCNLAIDYYLASKPMMTFLFIVGVSSCARQKPRVIPSAH